MDRESRSRMTQNLFAPAQVGHLVHSTEPKSVVAPSAEMLLIESEELAFADKLVPLLRSLATGPAAFTNVYRLMKVRLDDQEWHGFLTNHSYKQVLFLLALVTNVPELAAFLFTRSINWPIETNNRPGKEFASLSIRWCPRCIGVLGKTCGPGFCRLAATRHCLMERWSYEPGRGAWHATPF